MNQQIPDINHNFKVQLTNIIGPRPILFFILALIIGESFFWSIIFFTTIDNIWKGFIILVSTLYLVLLVVYVALLTWYKPKHLMYDQKGHMLDQVFGQFGNESNIINYAELIMEKPIQGNKLLLPNNTPRQLPGPKQEGNTNE